MNEFSDWLSSNWFELGILLLQLATLAAVVWFARGVLRIAMTFQGRADAFHPAAAAQEEPAPQAQPLNSGLRGLIPMDPAPSQPRARVAYVGPEGDGVWRSLVKWLNTPMGNAPVAWRRWTIRRA